MLEHCTEKPCFENLVGMTSKFQETDFYPKNSQYFPRRKSTKYFEDCPSKHLRVNPQYL